MLKVVLLPQRPHRTQKASLAALFCFLAAKYGTEDSRTARVAAEQQAGSDVGLTARCRSSGSRHGRTATPRRERQP